MELQYICLRPETGLTNGRKNAIRMCMMDGEQGRILWRSPMDGDQVARTRQACDLDDATEGVDVIR
jgi:hypothetical protein